MRVPLTWVVAYVALSEESALFRTGQLMPRLQAGSVHLLSALYVAAVAFNADLRRAMRALPPERRRALLRAIREGRAVDDPRDARLAVAWAQRVQAAWWPRWLLPQKPPHGLRAVLWLLHAVWIVVALVTAVGVSAWRGEGIVRWLVVGVLGCTIAGAPWLFALILRTRWNAGEAERRNRELVGESLGA